MNSKTLLAVAGLCLAGLALYFILPSQGEKDSPGSAGPAGAPEHPASAPAGWSGERQPAQPTSQPVAAGRPVLPQDPRIALDPVSPREVRAGQEPPGWIAYPDGTALPPLNGVERAVGALKWPPGRPYAPVIGRIRLEDGRDWYVHADGCRSTTIFNDFTYLGETRTEALTVVFEPKGAMPRPLQAPALPGGQPAPQAPGR